MNPKTTADVVVAVEKVFSADLTIERPKTLQLFKPFSPEALPRQIFGQICRTAYCARRKADGYTGFQPFYRASEVGRKLWDHKVDDSTIDDFVSAAGKLGLTIGIIDHHATHEMEHEGN